MKDEEKLLKLFISNLHVGGGSKVRIRVSTVDVLERKPRSYIMRASMNNTRMLKESELLQVKSETNNDGLNSPLITYFLYCRESDEEQGRQMLITAMVTKMDELLNKIFKAYEALKTSRELCNAGDIEIRKDIGR